jgi:ABC-type Fe3+-siderophore transport system permease subunit
MIGMKICEKCGYHHRNGRCCIDIYQQLGRTKGPSIVGKVLIAFVLPVFAFIGFMVLMDYLLSTFMSRGGIKTVIVFLASIAATAVFVQLVRIFTRKPVNTESKRNNAV